MDNLSAGILSSFEKGDQIPVIIPRRYPLNRVAGFLRNQWPLSTGMPGRNATESVAGFDRNWWPTCSGIRSYRASGLNLVVCAIVLWNTVYLERAVQALRDSGQDVDDKLLSHLSPLGWEHINLTGDYVWQQSRQVAQGKFRPLRMLADA
jgi:hypothetical protein